MPLVWDYEYFDRKKLELHDEIFTNIIQHSKFGSILSQIKEEYDIRVWNVQGWVYFLFLNLKYQ